MEASLSWPTFSKTFLQRKVLKTGRIFPLSSVQTSVESWVHVANQHFRAYRPPCLSCTMAVAGIDNIWDGSCEVPLRSLKRQTQPAGCQPKGWIDTYGGWWTCRHSSHHCSYITNCTLAYAEFHANPKRKSNETALPAAISVWDKTPCRKLLRPNAVHLQFQQQSTKNPLEFSTVKE